MELIDDFQDAIYGTNQWRECGITRKIVFEFAKRSGRGACMLHHGSAVDVLPSGQTLVFAISDCHAYFCADMAVRKRLTNKVTPISPKIKRPAKEPTTPDASQWSGFQ